MKQVLVSILSTIVVPALLVGAGEPIPPPDIQIVSPPPGAALPGPADVTLIAEVITPEPFELVEFLLNGEPVGIGHPIRTAVSMRYALTVPDVHPGAYEAMAVVLGADGVVHESPPVPFEVVPIPHPVLVGVVATDPEATEPGPLTDVLDTARFTLRRSGPTDLPLDVYLSWHGEAEPGRDYREVPTRVTIPGGQSWAHIIIEPVDDNLAEGDEVVAVQIEHPVAASVLPPYEVDRHRLARAVIHDNDQPVNQPPHAELLQPLDGQTFLAPADILLMAGAFDLDGRVVSVEFFEGEHSLGMVPSPEITPAETLIPRDTGTHPLYRLRWAEVPPGTYVLTAVATDDRGATGRSQPVHIKVVGVEPPPVVIVNAVDPQATEPTDAAIAPDVAVFVVSRTGPVEQALPVYFRLAGDAQNGADYREIPHRVEIPAGAEAAEVIIVPLDDRIYEGDESVVLHLLPRISITLSPLPDHGEYNVGEPGIARAVIHDNQSPPINLPPRVHLVEPPDETRLPAPATVRLAARAADPDGYVRTVTFLANGRPLAEVPGFDPALPGDGSGADEIEPADLYTWVWESVGPGTYELVAIAEDDDGATSVSDAVRVQVYESPDVPFVNVVVVDDTATEGGRTDTGEPDTAAFKVIRTGPVDGPLVVRYDVFGTATPGDDFVMRTLGSVDPTFSGEVLIPEGRESAEITIIPLDDDEPERQESVVIRIVRRPCPDETGLHPGCYRIGQHPEATAIILDDDVLPNLPPRVAILRPEDGSEIPGPADIRIVADAADPDGRVRAVEFFANGRSLGTVVPPPDGSLAPELEHPFQILWPQVLPGKYQLIAVATDNDGASTRSQPVGILVNGVSPRTVVQVFATDETASESTPNIIPDPARFTVVREGSADDALMVFYRVGGTATNGEDYRRLTGEVLIPAGEVAADILIAPIDDQHPEPTESVVVELLPPLCIAIEPPPPECYLVGSHEIAEVHILDNDTAAQLPPTAKMTAPPQGSVFVTPATIAMRVAAVDPDGWVQHIEWYANHRLLHEQSIQFFRPPPPGQEQVFEYEWQDAPAGLQLLRARVTDTQGLSAWTRPVPVWVRESPDIPVVNIYAVDRLAREEQTQQGINTATLKVLRAARDISEPLYVHYELSGSATPGEDYQPLRGVVEIPAGRYSARIEIVPIDDDIPERRESVRVSLFVATDEVPPPYRVGRHGCAGVIIVDQDLGTPPVCRPLPAHLLYLCRAAEPGSAFQVEASSDLREWVPVETITVTEDALHYVDAFSPETPVRFYRLIPVDTDPMRAED